MKYTKTILILSILLLSGCASTIIKDGKLTKRTTAFKLSLIPGTTLIDYNSETEGLEVGEAEILKEGAE